MRKRTCDLRWDAAALVIAWGEVVEGLVGPGRLVSHMPSFIRISMFFGLESNTGFRRFDVFCLRIKYRFPPLVFGYYRCKLGI